MSTFWVLGIAGVLFASGRVRLDITALAVVLALMLSGILSPRQWQRDSHCEAHQGVPRRAPDRRWAAPQLRAHDADRRFKLGFGLLGRVR